MNAHTLLEVIDAVDPLSRYGKVTKVIGLVAEAIGPPDVALGELCILGDPETSDVRAEVVGFRDGRVLLMPLGEMEGIRPETVVFPTRAPLRIPVGDALQGRIIDGLGNPLDSEGPIHVLEHRPVFADAPHPLKRQRVTEPIGTGVRALDGLVTCGRGQRLGIFSGSGVGKSTLLGIVARNSDADVNVIALVGERGKEVLDFVEDNLGPQGLRRSVVVVTTSEQPALIRLKAAFAATTIAEYFRDQGKNVMLMMDSLTRVAMAQREIGLTAGEPPPTKGYTPSVFALLPRLLERVGNTDTGSIIVPLGGVEFNLAVVHELTRLSANVFVIAVKISAPIMMALFLVSVAMGVLARTVPQMNVFIVGFPIQIAVGIAALMISLPMFYVLLERLWKSLGRDFVGLLQLLS